jgi:hypothetical protein
MHTQHPGIESTWEQRIDDKCYLRVFVWENAESMQQAFNRHKYMAMEPDYCGRCIGAVWQIKDGKRRCPPKFGELHLVRDIVGGGYVAHEIQHLVNYWSEFKNWKRIKDDERIAAFAGNITMDFWDNFYERYNSRYGDNK